MSEPKRAAITGASRGLGRALALELGRRGFSLALIARDRDALARVSAEVRELGGQATPIAADLAEERDVQRAAAVVHDALGQVDLLINNAATVGPTPLPLLLDLEPDALQQALLTNVVGPFRLTRALAGPMVLRGQGTIVAISTDAAAEVYPRWGAYGASKVAQDFLWRTFAVELAQTGLVFAIFDPGEMDTDMHAQALPEADRTTLRRPEDVARVIVERLLSPGAVSNGARLVVEV